MEYFDWYGIEPALNIDENVLKQAYYKKSRNYHPDLYINASEDEQERIMQYSVLNTKAYDTLKNFDTRLKYILEQTSLIAENDKYVLSSDFLMKMMDINEQISEAVMTRDSGAIEKCSELIEGYKSELKNDIKPIITKNKINALSEQDLQRLLDYYYKLRYVRRLNMQLQDEKEL